MEESLEDVKKRLELEERENAINQKIQELKDREIAGLNRDFERMKEVTDRAIKLAETSKPRINWESYVIPILAIIAVISAL